MLASRRVRFILILVILGGVVAIVVNFLVRRQHVVVQSESEILSPGIKRRATGFDYSEHRDGREVFSVKASVGTLTEENIHSLKDVRLVHYAPEGGILDSVHGSQAVYDMNHNKIVFSGAVEMELEDQTRIFSDSVRADLGSNIVNIDQHFRFQRGDVSGEGARLTYRIRERQVEISGQFSMELPSDSGEIRASAQTTLYDLRHHKLDLRGQALLSQPPRLLKSDWITIVLTEERRVERIASLGASALQASRSQFFRGNKINLYVDPTQNQLRNLEVLGVPGVAPAESGERAEYREVTAKGIHHLVADRIVAEPAISEVPRNSLSLRRFRAGGAVRFDSTVLQIEAARCDELSAAFNGQETLQTLDMKGAVYIRRLPAPRSLREETLTTGSLSARFDADNRLREAQTRGETQIGIREGTALRTLKAEQSLLLAYQGGEPHSLEARGASEFEEREPGQTRRLQAPLIQVDFDSGLMRRLRAGSGVQTETEAASGRTVTSSRRLEADFNRGRLRQVTQSGDFKLRDETEQGTTELFSEGATFNPASNEIRVRGKELSHMRFKSSAGPGKEVLETETEADRFSLNRTSSAVAAAGNIKSVMKGGEEPLAVVAGRMDYEPREGWLIYQGRPRLISGENVISGDELRLNSASRAFTFSGHVESNLVDTSTRPTRNYRVTADRLTHQTEPNQTLYRGDVRLVTEDLRVRAPSVQFLSGESAAFSKPETVLAWGGVTIVEGERKTRGDRAVFLPGSGKVTVTGNPAELREPERGTVHGRVITFYLGEKKFTIESPETEKKP